MLLTVCGKARYSQSVYISCCPFRASRVSLRDEEPEPEPSARDLNALTTFLMRLIRFVIRSDVSEGKQTGAIERMMASPSMVGMLPLLPPERRNEEIKNAWNKTKGGRVGEHCLLCFMGCFFRVCIVEYTCYALNNKDMFSRKLNDCFSKTTFPIYPDEAHLEKSILPVLKAKTTRRSLPMKQLLRHTDFTSHGSPLNISSPTFVRHFKIAPLGRSLRCP